MGLYIFLTNTYDRNLIGYVTLFFITDSFRSLKNRWPFRIKWCNSRLFFIFFKLVWGTVVYYSYAYFAVISYKDATYYNFQYSIFMLFFFLHNTIPSWAKQRYHPSLPTFDDDDEELRKLGHDAECLTIDISLLRKGDYARCAQAKLLAGLLLSFSGHQYLYDIAYGRLCIALLCSDISHHSFAASVWLACCNRSAVSIGLCFRLLYF